MTKEETWPCISISLRNFMVAFKISVDALYIQLQIFFVLIPG